MTPRPAKREHRGFVTMQRIAQQMALEVGMPFERAYELVRVMFRVIREDMLTAQRFVLPGALILERRPEGDRRSHRVKLVLKRHAKACERVRQARRARRAAAPG